jgi:YHS domain-containing protein
MTRQLFLSLPLLAFGLTAAETPKLALKGYDPVAYFTLSKPTIGLTDFAAVHNGLSYQFANAEHKQLFTANPEKYLPQYNGFCAWAVGHNYTAPSDPLAWKIVNGKLYLNYNTSIQKKWLAEESDLIRKGDDNWPTLKNKK